MELVHPRYQSGEVLGRGAEGVVLRVVDHEAPDRPLVAKLVREGVATSRLEGEFALLARLRVPGLVRAHDLARDTRTGRPFLVEEYVDGPDAVEWIASAADARVSRLSTLFVSLARTFDGLHEAGFVHGDPKPAHVRIARSDASPRLFDLGCALHAAATSGAGFTRAWAAPELVAGGPASVATDLYGLGAVMFGAATGRAPDGGPLRTRAPWVPPSLADVVDGLLRSHPRDRPASARAVIAELAGEHAFGSVAGGTLVGRERELYSLRSLPRGVTWLVGPSGVGKSHLAREAAMRAMLEAREVRVFADHEVGPELIAFLRGSGLWPFTSAAELLVIDDVTSPEVRDAIEAFRCRVAAPDFVLLATAQGAPEGAPTMELAALPPAAFDALCRAIDVPKGDVASLASTTSRLPGWLLAARGRTPLSPGSVLARLSDVSHGARALLARVALLGGAAPLDPSFHDAAAELFSVGLVERAHAGDPVLRLPLPALANDLAAALSTPELLDEIAPLALERATPATLVMLASLGSAHRARFLAAAASRARSSEARAIELVALERLAEASSAEASHLRRLERLARDAANPELHGRVLAWLEASGDPALVFLAEARSAERHARAGDHTKADGVLANALAGSADVPLARATGEATRGTLALYRADWAVAEGALGEARALLATENEREELARIDHNLGVVALYRGDVAGAATAFGRALETKRALGDLAGVRAALLNLGLAYTRLGELVRAEQVLNEALALARSLGERMGRAWTLAALAELHVRRAAPREAERWVAEAEAHGELLPPGVSADLQLLRAEIGLLEGNAERARAALAGISSTLRADDALIDGRAITLEARALLVALPSDRRRAARLAVTAIRRARAAGIPEIEGQARAVLGEARVSHTAIVSNAIDVEEHLWRAVAELADARDDAEAATVLARCVVKSSGAERAFVVVVEGERFTQVFGVDAEGFPLTSPAERTPREAVLASLSTGEPLHTRTGVARIAIASGAREGRSVVVLAEHRYHPQAFDSVDATTARRWAALARFVGRRVAQERPSSPAPSARITITEPHETTVVPTLAAAAREFPGILGESPAMRRVLGRLEAALDSDLPVLVVGETGAGKELFARALHDHGPRAGSPFVAVNCAAIPDSLFEAELFGHVRGSFTGADRGRGGLAARARDGTLFLDEIGELPAGRQATLLRVLESKKFRPVGSDEELPLDARIVTATNRDLALAVEEGSFRRDLLYRLDVVTIRVPPLREREGDIALLARHFLRAAKASSDLAQDALDALEAYTWPGNVRELAHMMQRLAMSRLRRIDREHLPRTIRAALPRTTPRAEGDEPRNERAEVEAALAACHGNITHAAERLGLTRHGLKKRMLRLGMRAARSSA